MKDNEKIEVEIPHVLVSDVKEFFIPGLDESKFLVLHLKDYRIVSLRYYFYMSVSARQRNVSIYLIQNIFACE